MGRVVALVANGPTGNRGCQAIEIGTLHLLEATGAVSEVRIYPFGGDRSSSGVEPTAQIRVVRFDGRHPDRRFGSAWLSRRMRGAGRLAEAVPSDYRFSFRPLQRALSGTHDVLLLGGDNFTMDYGKPTSFWMLARYLKRQGYRTFLWGASVGPFGADTEYERSCAEELRRLDGILVREDRTLEYLASIGVAENVRRISDPAFLMEPQPPVTLPCIEEFRDSIGLNLSPLISQYRASTEEWLDVAAAAVRQIVARFGRRVTLIPHVVLPHTNDHAFLAEVQRRAGVGTAAILLPPTLTAPELKHVIGLTRVFIGARTHATIASLSMGVPTISIAYSSKAFGINLDTYGHERYVIPAEEVSSDRLVAMLEEVLRLRERISAQLRRVMPTLREQALSASEYLAYSSTGGPMEETG